MFNFKIGNYGIPQISYQSKQSLFILLGLILPVASAWSQDIVVSNYYTSKTSETRLECSNSGGQRFNVGKTARSQEWRAGSFFPANAVIYRDQLINYYGPEHPEFEIAKKKTERETIAFTQKADGTYVGTFKTEIWYLNGQFTSVTQVLTAQDFPNFSAPWPYEDHPINKQIKFGTESWEDSVDARCSMYGTESTLWTMRVYNSRAHHSYAINWLVDGKFDSSTTSPPLSVRFKSFPTKDDEGKYIQKGHHSLSWESFLQ